jgi:hypothetical protein
MSITEARERGLLVRDSVHYTQQQKFFREAHDKVIYFWPGKRLVPNRPDAGAVADRIYEKFRQETAWFFFRQKREEGELTFVRFDFPWVPQADRFKAIVGHFSVTKLAKSIRTEFMQTYRELLNAPDTQINNIGLVLIGSGYLSGVDVFGTSAIVKFDAPPTQQVAIQGSGRANRKGGFAKFPYDTWKLPEYVILREWLRPPEAAQYGLVSGLRQERMREFDGDDDEPEFESALVEDLRDRIDQARNPATVRDLRRQLAVATRRVATEERTEQRLRQYERLILEDFSSRPMPLDASAQPLSDADVLSPSQIVRQFSLGNIRTEVYNIVGQLFFRNWSVDYEVIKPKLPAEQCTTLLPVLDCLPTGFCFSWAAYKQRIVRPQVQPLDEGRIRELERAIETKKRLLEDVDVHQFWRADEVKRELRALERDLQALQAQSPANTLLEQWIALVDVVLEQTHLYGNVFSEIVRGRTGRLFVVVKPPHKKVHELLPAYFGDEIVEPEELLAFLVHKGFAVWQIRMTLEFTLESQEEEEKQTPVHELTHQGQSASKRRKPAEVITLDYRLEPFNAHRSWAKQAPLETSLADVDRTAFNAFFDLRTMDREMISIQRARSQKAWELGVALGLFQEQHLRQSQTAGGPEDPALHAKLVFEIANLAPTMENQRGLRTALGHMFIDGMADWNQAVVFLSQAFNELLVNEYIIDYALCATLCGVLYRNAYGDFEKTTAFVRRYFVPKVDDPANLIILLNFTAQFGFDGAGDRDESLRVVFDFLERYMHVNMRAALSAPNRNGRVAWRKSPLYKLTEWIKGKRGSKLAFDAFNRLDVARKLKLARTPSEFKTGDEYAEFVKVVFEKKLKLADLDSAGWKKRHADYMLEHTRANYDQLLRLFRLDQIPDVRDLAATLPSIKAVVRNEAVAYAVGQALRVDVTEDLVDALNAIFMSAIGFTQGLTIVRLVELLGEFKGRTVLPFYDTKNSVFTIGADSTIIRHRDSTKLLGSLEQAMRAPRFGVVKTLDEQWRERLQTYIRSFLGVPLEWLDDAALVALYRGRMLVDAKLLWRDSVNQFPRDYAPSPIAQRYLTQLLKIENQNAYTKLKNVCAWTFGDRLRWLPFLVQTGAFWSANRVVGMTQAAIQTIAADHSVPAVRAFLRKAAMLGEPLKHMFIPSIAKVAKTHKPTSPDAFWKAVSSELAKVLAAAFIEVDREYVL